MVQAAPRSHMADSQFPRRLHDLEEKFGQIQPELRDSPEARAISILHAMMHELWRGLRSGAAPLEGRGVSIQDIADLYRNAPKMEGKALNEPLPPGTPAPDFALPDASGTPVRLGDFRGKPVILIFYPLDWSPGCSQQLDLMESERAEFQRRNVQVLGISVDSLYSHGAWAAVRGIQFPLLADFHPKGATAEAYHVWREPDGHSERALFIVDPEGIIRHSEVSPFLHHVPDIYQLFQHLDHLFGATPAQEPATGDRARRMAAVP